MGAGIAPCCPASARTEEEMVTVDQDAKPIFSAITPPDDKDSEGSDSDDEGPVLLRAPSAITPVPVTISVSIMSWKFSGTKRMANPGRWSKSLDKDGITNSLSQVAAKTAPVTVRDAQRKSRRWYFSSVTVALSCLTKLTDGFIVPGRVDSAEEEASTEAAAVSTDAPPEGKATSEKAAAATAVDAEPERKSAAETSTTEAAGSPAVKIVQRPKCKNPISMVGIFSQWKYGINGALDPLMDQVDECPSSFPELPEGMIRLKKVVKMTSSSFSFQVVCPDQDWNWRLYPRDFSAVMWGAHVSKQGVMRSGEREKVVIGVGDKKKGDGKNLHIISPVKGGGDICTVWMDMPIKDIEGEACSLDLTTEDKLEARAPKVWYIFEDKDDPGVVSSVQLQGGDGMDIEKYRSRMEA